MRLFAAVDVPVSIQEDLQDWWLAVCEFVDMQEWRTMPMKNWHVTLAFYGDISGDSVNDLSDLLAEEAENMPVMMLKMGGFGAFPRLSRPHILWAGVDDFSDSNQLKSLARCCRRAGRVTLRKSKGKGSVKELPFRGHITLARSQPDVAPLPVHLLHERVKMPELIWQVDSLQLYQSYLRKDGAIYTLLDSFALQG